MGRIWIYGRGPGIVSAAENDPVVGGRMVEEPDADERRRIRISPIGFAFEEKGLRGDFARIGRDAVDNFQAVAVGFVFCPAAESVGYWREQNCHHENNQKEKRQCGPIALARQPGRWTDHSDRYAFHTGVFHLSGRAPARWRC